MNTFARSILQGVYDDVCEEAYLLKQPDVEQTPAIIERREELRDQAADLVGFL